MEKFNPRPMTSPSIQIALRLTRNEKERINKAAKAAGVSIQAFSVQAIMFAIDNIEDGTAAE